MCARACGMFSIPAMQMILISFMLMLCAPIVVASEPQSFNIQVRHNAKGDEHTGIQTVKAHLFEALLEFFDLDMSNQTEIADLLSTIPHNITVDMTANLDYEDRDYGHDEYSCLKHVPTYLFRFSREDILEEFGSDYFVLKPDPNIDSPLVANVYIPIPNVSPKSSTKLWIHIPKTGSSFENSAFSLGYAERSHDPCPVGKKCDLITLLRSPRQRLISWFYYSPPEFEKCELYKFRDASEVEYKKALQTCFDNFLENNLFDGPQTLFWGCEAKMLAGYHCDSSTQMLPSPLRTDEGLTNSALSRMRDPNTFKFIGNTDFFDASVTLMHQMLGGQMNIRNSFIKVNTRQINESDRALSGNHNLDKIHYDSDFLCDGRELCDNVPDETVYSEMKRMMILNIIKHHNTPIKVVDDPYEKYKTCPSGSPNRKDNFFIF